MNESHKELLRQVQELLQASTRSIVATYDRIDSVLDSCLTMGGTATSSSTSAGTDGSCVAEEPAPASFSPDASIVVPVDVEDLATPTPARCSIEGPSRDTAELRSASAPAPPPATTTATVDLIPVLAAAAASDGTLDGDAIGGVVETPATCSMNCLPRHPMAAPVLVASSPPTQTEYVLHANILVAAVPLAVAGEFWEVLAPTAYTPTARLQQLYNDCGFFRPSSIQCVTYKTFVHRPMPWPSFLNVHVNGDETRPLPWPSFRVNYNCESPSVVVMKPSGRCTSDRSPAIIRDVLEFQISAPNASRKAVDDMDIWALIESTFMKQLAAARVQSMKMILKFATVSKGDFYTVAHAGSIISNDMCISSELRCLEEVLLFLTNWSSSSDCVQSVQATFGRHPCSIARFTWDIIRSIELKLLSNGSMPITLRTVLLDSGSFSALSYQDASHWHEHFVTGVYIHVKVICSVWRLLIGSVTSVPFLNLEKFLVRPMKQHGELLCISGLHLTMLILCNSYAAFVGVCFPCSVHDPIYKWLMPWSMTESDVVKWYTEPTPLLACRVYTDLNRASMSFGMLRASLPVLGNRQPHAIFLTARTVMLQSTGLYSKEQSSWIYEMPKEDYFEVEQMIASFLQALISSCLFGLISQCGFDIHQWMGWSHQLECFTIATHWSLHELVCYYQVSSCLPVAPLGVKESVCYLFSGWMCEAYWKRFLTDSNSPSDANVVRLSFWRKTHTNAALMQGGTRADISSLVNCRLWLQNHQVTMHIQMVWSPHIQVVCTSFLCMITQRTYHAMLLMLCLNLLVRLLQTWPPPIAHYLVTSNIFSYPDLSILALCEMWLLNHLGTMLIG